MTGAIRLSSSGWIRNPGIPSYPRNIRTYGVVGAQAGFNENGGPPNSLHDAISTFEHPQAGQPLARGAGRTT